MKPYEFTLSPLSDFGTLLKGDTLFGCFCWQVAYDESLVEGGLEGALKVYDRKPFVVFSSAFLKFGNSSPTYVLKRPDLPLAKLFPDNGKDRKALYQEFKEQKRRRWMAIENKLAVNIRKARFFNGDELYREFGIGSIVASSRPHNTINRTTLSTGIGAFAPYETETFSYHPDSTLAVMVLLDEDLTSVKQVEEGFARLGKFGFGRDASIGMGRFQVVGYQDLPATPAVEAEGIYTLAPCLPNSDDFEKTFFSPFIRFGKHGDCLATGGLPFKNPVIMADEGAVLFKKPGATVDKPYVGKAVRGVSKNQETAVVQGYAPHIPITLE